MEAVWGLRNGNLMSFLIWLTKQECFIFAFSQPVTECFIKNVSLVMYLCEIAVVLTFCLDQPRWLSSLSTWWYYQIKYPIQIKIRQIDVFLYICLVNQNLRKCVASVRNEVTVTWPWLQGTSARQTTLALIQEPLVLSFNTGLCASKQTLSVWIGQWRVWKVRKCCTTMMPNPWGWSWHGGSMHVAFSWLRHGTL